MPHYCTVLCLLWFGGINKQQEAPCHCIDVFNKLGIEARGQGDTCYFFQNSDIVILKIAKPKTSGDNDILPALLKNKRGKERQFFF